MKNKRTIFLGGILFLSCINFAYIAWSYGYNGYLPPPFVFDKANTFMDFYNTLYWSGQDGIYSIWNSVYPPLNFLFLQAYQFLFLDDLLGFGDAFVIRQEAGGQISPLVSIYVICLLIAVSVSFRQIAGLKTIIILFVIFLLSPAFLFAIERGNLILLSIPVLSWYIFSNKQTNKALALAVLVNLKPYFIIFYIVQLFNLKTHKESGNLLFLAPIFSLILFLVTGLLLNQEFHLLPLNFFGFATNGGVLNPADILSFPSSIIAFAYLRGFITEFSIPPIYGYLAKLVVYLYLIKSLLLIYKSKLNFEDLAIFSIIFITNYSISTGGYGILYYIPAIALLYKQNNYLLVAIIISSMYVGIWDIVPIYRYNGGDMDVYLSGESLKVASFISLGSIIRPAANFLVLLLFFKNIQKRYSYAPI